VSLGPNDLILLDTNVLVHWCRQDSTGIHLKTHYKLEERSERPLYSSITEGELFALVKGWNWGEKRIQRLEDLMSELVRVESGHPSITKAYAELSHLSRQMGQNMRENDLWIAATAQVTGAVLLTCDGDFCWLSPKPVQVEFVPGQP
jgi:tRNA(fMet)-specific endonuclease VapC